MLNTLNQSLSRNQNKLFKGLLIGFIIAIFLSIFQLLGLFNTWNEKLTDNLYTQKVAPDNIAIIAIDDKSIQEIGRFPWDREVYSKLLNKLSENPPKVIGIDVSFLEKSDDKSDIALSTSIRNLKNTKVVLAGEWSSDTFLNPIEPLKAVSTVGFANIFPDEDGIVRKVNLGMGGINSFSKEISGIQNGTSSLRINFLGKQKTFNTYSLSEVLNGKIDGNIFKNKIVLIGATAPDLHDDQSVPTEAKMPGVEIQANAINTLLSSSAKSLESKRVTIFTILIIAVLSSIIFIFLPPVGVAVAALISIFIYIIFVIYAFDNGVIRNIIYPVLAILLSAIANIIYKYRTENAAKKFLRKTFSYYLSESVLSHLLENPDKIKLGGERKELTVLFSDIAGFTTISESMQAHELAEMLNKYLTQMTDVVFKYEGVLDKYIGDAIMAFWGAPNEVENHALNACITALEMQKKIKENFNFAARVGINSGEMVVGNMGSNQRFDYSLLGDNVNLGSRLEGINKMYGTKICMSESTYTLVKDKVTARKLDTVAVKGKKTGIPIYELIHLGNKTKKEKDFLSSFEKARKLYEIGKFKSALQEFKLVNKNYPEDPTTPIYIDRIKELITDPPINWDGVYHATSK